MSTLGGNKGERNPSKPKFAALDINSLYRSSRGETFEPTTQKNAAPRKHGMQSLGKVPSARRPPANLPSLKAETSAPSSNTPSQTTSNEQVSANSTSASWADSGSTQTGTTNVTSNNNLSGSGASGTGQTNQNRVEHQQGGSSSSSSWSAVATGNVSLEDSASQPPLYQSPQFQNEFPSLDGTATTTSSSLTTSSNVNAMTQKPQNQNSFDSGGGGNNGLNLRPSTDAASWMQQQQSNSSNSGNARGVGGENGSQQSQQGTGGVGGPINFPTADLGPPKVMALMPSFLRGNAGIGNSPPSMIHSSSSRERSERGDRIDRSERGDRGGGDIRDGANLMQKSSLTGGNRSGGRNTSHYDRSSYNNDYSNNGLPPRHLHNHHHRQAPPRRQNNMNNINNSNNNNNSDDRSSSYEPEIIMQRPIIKEEELERIDSLARDDAWSKHDEIDYNKKLQFSDDETEDTKPKDLNNDKKMDAWRDEKRDTKQQQNGPRSMESSYIEKMKMKREEEERIERERINAAQRKLQELDEKSKQKQISMEKSQEKDIVEEKTSSGLSYTINESDKKLDYGKSKYQINDKYDSYEQYGRNTNVSQSMSSGSVGGDFKKSQFQSNLPPRFQKQQHIERQDDRREKPNQNYKPLHQQDSKNVPFAPYEQQQQQASTQQQRWSQYNKTNQQVQPPRRNMSSLSQSSSDDNRQNSSKSSYNRRRQESEEDDYMGQRFGKDSSIQQKKSTIPSTQITRSMSDSSDKLSDHNRSEKSTSREYLTNSNVCWAEVCENDKRSSLDAKDRRRVSESSAISDDQPRTILQRNKPLQEQLQGKDMKKENKDEEKSVLNEITPKSLESNDEKGKITEQQSSSSTTVDQNKKSLEIIPEKDQVSLGKSDDLNAGKKDSSSKLKDMSSKDLDDNKSGNKRSPHSNRYESSRSGRGSGSYNSGSGYRGNWPQRRGGHSRGGRYDYSDSENSEEYDNDWNSGRGGSSSKSSSLSRKDAAKRDHFNSQKEGFSPRGEPSRRGRGGGLTGSQSSSSFRRSGGSSNSNSSITAPIKRIDNYGPPSSKSPFGSNDEKFSGEKREISSKEREKLSDEDRTKQKQKALSDGLMNKNVKDSSNLAMQKASSPSLSTSGSSIKPEDINKHHSTENTMASSNQSGVSSYDQKDKKNSESDDKSMGDKISASGNRSNTSSSYNSSRQQKHENPKISSSSSSSKAISKPPTSISNTQQDQVNSGSGKTISNLSSTNLTVTSSSGLSQSSQKPTIDSRNANNNYRNDQRGGPASGNTGGSGGGNNNVNANTGGTSRMAPRFVKQRDISGPGTNANRMGSNYWDKNHSETLHDESSKVSLMQHLNASGSMQQQQQQQQQLSSSNSNMLNSSKTDVMKQQQNSQLSSVTGQQQQAPMLDGASLPKQTLIFENTSYKSAPPALKRPPQQQQQPQGLGQGAMNQKDSTPTINEMIEQQAKDHSLSSALQNLSFGQKPNDMVDMNFKFSFDTQLTDDGNSGFGSVTSSSSTHPSQTKASSLGLVGAKTGIQNSNILNTDALNMKVASCKKVWEEPSDHSGSNADDVMANFVAQQHMQYTHNNITAHHTGLSPQSFGYATSSANDHTSSLEHFNKSNDNDDSNSYPSPQQHMGGHVMHSQSQQAANLSMKAAEVFASTANVCKVKPTQQQMHQSGLSPPPQLQQNQMQQHQQTFYPTPNYQNIPTIPSPPVVYNSQAATGGLYNPYNMDAARAQMFSYQAGSANNSLSFNTFMQTPPNLASAPTHEMYQNLSQYRATVQPYNQTPQLNNPNAVLISSATASSSMMGSKSNTPQQIGAIGSKSSAPQTGSSAAAAGQYNPQYMNHVYHQNNYYPNSTAQQANAYYNATGGAPASGNYGIFSGTNVNPPPQQAQMANYGSVGQYPLNSQMLNNLVYRGGPVMNNSNGSSTSGSNSNTGSASGGGYMKQQQQQHQQSQLQDPASLMSSDGNFFGSMNSQMGQVSSQANYSQISHFSPPNRTMRKSTNNNFGSSITNQGKSQYFSSANSGSKRDRFE